MMKIMEFHTLLIKGVQYLRSRYLARPDSDELFYAI